jgi:hypothetical protein
LDQLSGKEHRVILVSVILFVGLLELTFFLALAMAASVPIPPITDDDEG